MAENFQLVLVGALIVTMFTTITAAAFLIVLIGPRQKDSTGSAEVDPKDDKNLSPFYDTQYKNLEKYLEVNRRQNSGIYGLTVVFISAGFIIIIVGVLLNILNGNSTSENGSWIVVIASGVVTEFIAATVLFVYRSVFQQTSEYFRVLERFATVGMSIKILDNLKKNATPTENLQVVEAKIEIAKKLLDRPGIVSTTEKSPADKQSQ